jgi:hypothetical protein
MSTTWNNNSIQFPRLLAEIRAVGLSDGQYSQLGTSMDLERDDIERVARARRDRLGNHQGLQTLNLQLPK